MLAHQLVVSCFRFYPFPKNHTCLPAAFGGWTGNYLDCAVLMASCCVGTLEHQPRSQSAATTLANAMIEFWRETEIFVRKASHARAGA